MSDIDAMAGEGLKSTLVEEARAMLKRHGLASVKIFATYNVNDGRSIGIDAGAGNYYANVGQAVLWLEGERHRERRDVEAEP